jgi:hypothetical protein
MILALFSSRMTSDVALSSIRREISVEEEPSQAGRS